MGIRRWIAVRHDGKRATHAHVVLQDGTEAWLDLTVTPHAVCEPPTDEDPAVGVVRLWRKTRARHGYESVHDMELHAALDRLAAAYPTTEGEAAVTD